MKIGPSVKDPEQTGHLKSPFNASGMSRSAIVAVLLLPSISSGSQISRFRKIQSSDSSDASKAPTVPLALSHHKDAVVDDSADLKP